MEGTGLSRKGNHLCDGHKVCEPDPGGYWNCRAERTRWSLVEDEAREAGVGSHRTPQTSVRSSIFSLRTMGNHRGLESQATGKYSVLKGLSGCKTHSRWLEHLPLNAPSGTKVAKYCQTILPPYPLHPSASLHGMIAVGLVSLSPVTPPLHRLGFI